MFSSNTAQSLSDEFYIEDAFSTFLYGGTGATQTIVNGIDLANTGGLVWIKGRSGATDHALYDTVRGATFDLASNTTAAQTTQSAGLTSFLPNGFSVGSLAKINSNGSTYASWTFRKQPKFLDIVTYTGNGANRTIAHNLGSVPGCIMVKRTNATSDWQVYHRGLANTQYLVLNSTAAAATGATRWNSTTPTSTAFSLGTDATVNANGATYVAYLFAHDAGGFGAAASDNVITCGSYVGNTTNPRTISLGYEPQWVLIKAVSGAGGNWFLLDTTRKADTSLQYARIRPDLELAESLANDAGINSSGIFIRRQNTNDFNVDGTSYIYIAIRRGPMRRPTSGTSVFSPVAYTGTQAPRTLTYGFAVDNWFVTARSGTNLAGYENSVFTRLLSVENALETSNADAWGGGWGPSYLSIDNNVGVALTSNSILNGTSTNYISYGFRRAPAFFDLVSYTGSGINRTVSHSLSVAPELMLVKGISGTTAWQVYSSSLLNTEYLVLNTTAAKATGATRWNSTAPTATQFSLGTASEVNTSGATYIAYLFASCAGVSKVGTYTGTAATLNIDCGFSAGARFVLIKRTDSTGDWLFWDTARGIVAANDPYLRLNSTAAEVTNTDWVDPLNAGFQLSSAAGNNANINNATYIYLAIA